MYTQKGAYTRRKAIMAGLGLAAVSTTADAGIFSDLFSSFKGEPATPKAPKVAPTMTTKLGATTYNNAYEFGNAKTDPYQQGHSLKPEGWTVEIEGSQNDGVYTIPDLMGGPFSHLEERTYRMRCVEAWSVVVPWNGRPLADIIRTLEPNAGSKYVNFECDTTGHGELPGVASRFSTIPWPYKESVTLDEAMNDLSFATFGAYGDQDLPQNGMPLKINFPWKWGYKSPKFVSKIIFSDEPGEATWNTLSSREYGWYSNVYPDISHPRWSQQTERRIWDQGDIERIPTEIYNGYGEQVAHMYPGKNSDYR